LSNESKANESFSGIVVIDDDPMISRQIEAAMGLTVAAYASSQAFREGKLPSAPAGFFVDIHLGHSDFGLDLIPEIRGLWLYTPIIVITSETNDDNIGRALVLGANDFVRKPLNKKELLARFKARSEEMVDRSGLEHMKYGDITVNLRLRVVSCNGLKAHLSSSNIDLLSYLIKTNGTLVSRDDLRSKVWGDLKVSDSAVDKKVFEVRRALKDIASSLQIQSEYGEGLRLVPTVNLL